MGSQWAVLAALRFFLAGTVALGHFALLVRTDPTGLFGNGYLNPGSSVFGFLILSGFSIAASLDRETGGFYRRRIVRIWPLYLTTIALGVALSLWFPSGVALPKGGVIASASSLSIIASLFMLQTVIGFSIPMVGQIWSLSPEWWHYMIAPALKKVPNLALGIWIVLSLFAYTHISTPPNHGIEGLSHGLPFLMLSWLWITGFLYYRIRETPIGFAVLALPSVFVLTLGGFTGAPLFISIFVLVISGEVTIGKRAIKICNFLGDLSFPLYLFHIPAMVIALKLGSNRSVITLASMILLSTAALYLVDYPSRKLFSRKPSTRTRAQQDQGQPTA